MKNEYCHIAAIELKSSVTNFNVYDTIVQKLEMFLVYNVFLKLEHIENFPEKF